MIKQIENSVRPSMANNYSNQRANRLEISPVKIPPNFTGKMPKADSSKFLKNAGELLRSLPGKIVKCAKFVYKKAGELFDAIKEKVTKSKK